MGKDKPVKCEKIGHGRIAVGDSLSTACHTGEGCSDFVYFSCVKQHFSINHVAVQLKYCTPKLIGYCKIACPLPMG